MATPKGFQFKLSRLARTAGEALKNVILAGNLVSLSLVRNPRRMMRYLTETLFLHKTLSSKRGIPQKNVFEVLPTTGIESIKLGELKWETWFCGSPFFGNDIVNLCLICQLVKPKVVFEIGTFEGYTTLHLALNSPADAKVYTLDVPKGFEGNAALTTTISDDDTIQTPRNYSCIDNSPVVEKISRLFGDSATFDFAPFHGKVDVFFIDGSHSYEYVRSDTINALKCCHSGSVIVWHDFRGGGVARYILELAKEREIYAAPGSSLAFMIVR